MAISNLHWQQRRPVETRLDKFGRIVLPKDVRDDFALEPGDALEVRETSEGILLTRIATSEEGEPLRTVGGVLVHDGTPSAAVEGAIERDRQARLDKLAGSLRKK